MPESSATGLIIPIETEIPVKMDELHARRRAGWFDYVLERPMPLAASLAIMVGAIEVGVDLTTWVELDISTFYGVPLVLAALARNRRVLWALAAFLMFMTFVAYATQVGSSVFFSVHEPYFVNRAMSAAALALSAILCDLLILAANRLAGQRMALLEQNQELDTLRRAADDASRRKTQLLASVSHDLRTPLASIALITDLIPRRAGDPAFATELPGLVHGLRRGTSSLSDLASALVDISSLDAGRNPLRSSKISLNGLLAEEYEQLLPLAEAKGLRLAIESPQPPVWLLIDRIKLSRVLTNLAGNAIKFTTAGAVTISAVLTAERLLLIHVCDTGAGIAPEDLERIWEEYGQLGNARRDITQGWGLGLAITRRLVAVMGGTISVESTPGRGTVFSVHLPASCVMT